VPIGIDGMFGSSSLKLAGDCAGHPEEAASNLVLWVPDRVTEEGDARLAPSSTL